MFTLPRQVPRWLQWVLAVTTLMAAMGALAQPDPPGRVGRIAEVSGAVWVFDHDQGEWTQAVRNRPVTGGDRLSTGNDARVSLRIGSTILRLAERTELEVVRLDDDRLQFQLQTGSAALRVRSREIAEETEFSTSEASFRPLRAGHYRFDRHDDITYATTLSGELLLDGAVAFPIASGQRMEFWRERGAAGEGVLRHRWAGLAQDELSAWLTREDQLEQRSASTRYVSPEMTGAEDLDRYGRWDRHPDYGPIWVPLSVTVGWVPYRNGHWAWVRPWGWTWIDEQPWGFAPFHYGRWVNWRGRWCWTPGGYVARPVFAPALVAWIGGPHVGIGIQLGPRRPLPGSSWVPLAPGEHYVPHHHASPRWADRINREPWPRDPSHRPPDRRIPNPPGGVSRYGNQAIPHAVTPVSREMLAPRVPHGASAPPLRDWARREPNPAARMGPQPVVPVAPSPSVLPAPSVPRVQPLPTAPRVQPLPAPAVATPLPHPQPQPQQQAQPSPPPQRGDDGLHRRPPSQGGRAETARPEQGVPAARAPMLPAPAIVPQAPPAATLPSLPAHRPAPVPQGTQRAGPLPQVAPGPVVQAPAPPPAATPAPRQRHGREAHEGREERDAPRARSPESRSPNNPREAPR